MDPTYPTGTKSTAGGDAPDRPDGPPRELDRLKTYLRANPAVLESDRELVSLLTPPAFRQGENVLDMQSFLIDKLKRQAAESESRVGQVRTALAADALDERRVQKAILAVARARGFDQLIEVITDDLPRLLTVQTVLIGVEAAEGTVPHPTASSEGGAGPGPIRLLPKGMVDEVLGRDRPVTLGEPPAGLKLFPISAVPMRSFCAASLTFTKSAPRGLLIIGARNSGRFSRHIARGRYAFLAQMIEENIRLWLDLPPHGA